MFYLSNKIDNYRFKHVSKFSDRSESAICSNLRSKRREDYLVLTKAMDTFVLDSICSFCIDVIDKSLCFEVCGIYIFLQKEITVEVHLLLIFWITQLSTSLRSYLFTLYETI